MSSDSKDRSYVIVCASHGSHPATGPPDASSWHSKVTGDSSEEKVHVGEESLPGSVGRVSIVSVGARVSLVKSCSAGVSSTLPAASIARTWKVWSPSANEA